MIFQSGRGVTDTFIAATISPLYVSFSWAKES